mgnify:CR=1 FL=1
MYFPKMVIWKLFMRCTQVQNPPTCSVKPSFWSLLSKIKVIFWSNLYIIQIGNPYKLKPPHHWTLPSWALGDPSYSATIPLTVIGHASRSSVPRNRCSSLSSETFTIWSSHLIGECLLDHFPSILLLILIFSRLSPSLRTTCPKKPIFFGSIQMISAEHWDNNFEFFTDVQLQILCAIS